MFLTKLSFVAIAFALAAFAVPSRAVAAESPGVVNINTASKNELMYLPGVGPKRADRIIEQREKRKFEALEQIRRVKGIGRVSFRKLKPYLAVSGPTTLTAKVSKASKDPARSEPKPVPSTPAAPEEPEQG